MFVYDMKGEFHLLEKEISLFFTGEGPKLGLLSSTEANMKIQKLQKKSFSKPSAISEQCFLFFIVSLSYSKWRDTLWKPLLLEWGRKSLWSVFTEGIN